MRSVPVPGVSPVDTARLKMALRIELDRGEIHIDGEAACCAHAVRMHRQRVVARLLAAGLSVSTLTTMLPEWAELIDEVDARIRSTLQ
jgi:hypothetical protein